MWGDACEEEGCEEDGSEFLYIYVGGDEVKVVEEYKYLYRVCGQ